MAAPVDKIYTVTLPPSNLQFKIIRHKPQISACSELKAATWFLQRNHYISTIRITLDNSTLINLFLPNQKESFYRPSFAKGLQIL